MSTIKVTKIQHPSAEEPAITLDTNGVTFTGTVNGVEGFNPLFLMGA